ncbi:hypothetical protein ABIQ69_12465 [Agromyces sp. G08B096]|uniref:Signal transduction histidine kinase n=1 Tax=Agromyces sp. G08B096 TaxID=3156399 RepID=A0AAU7W4L9_9MICO
MWIASIGAALAVALSIALTIAHWGEVRLPAVAVIGIMLVGAAAVAAATGTAPARAPFTSERLGLVVTLAVGAAIAEYVSTAGHNRYLYDDYGPAVIGMLILALAPFCNWTALAIAGVLAAGVLSILVVGAAATTATDGPLASLILVDVAVVLALTAAAAVYSSTIVDAVLAWQREANRAVLRRDQELRTGLARSAQQSRVSVLGREVLPFLAQIMTADRITVQDADRARELAEALRRALRAGIEATWLDDLAASLASARGIPVDIADRDGDAGQFADDQWAAVAALLTWLAADERAAAVRVRAERDLDDPNGRLVILAERGTRQVRRRELERFAAVASVVGFRTRTAISREEITVELDYVIE